MCCAMELFGLNLCEFSTNIEEGIYLREINTMEVITAMRDALKHVHTHRVSLALFGILLIKPPPPLYLDHGWGK